jgi:hypothetical protein
MGLKDFVELHLGELKFSSKLSEKGHERLHLHKSVLKKALQK